MIKHFKGSIFITVAGIIAAFLWGMQMHPGKELLGVFIVLFLAILEITLSFDNAVGFFVAYAAVFSFDKLNQALKK